VRSDVEYDFHLVDFHGTQAYTSACCTKFNENPPRTGFQLLSVRKIAKGDD